MRKRTTLAVLLAALAAGSTTAAAAIPSVIGPSGAPEFVSPIGIREVKPAQVPTVVGPKDPYAVIKLRGVPEVLGPTGAGAKVGPAEVRTLLDITVGPLGWTHPDPYTWHRVFAGNIANDWRTADQRLWTAGPLSGPGSVKVNEPLPRSDLRPFGDPAWPMAAPPPLVGGAPKVWQPTPHPGPAG
jgi:hypothetical protein